MPSTNTTELSESWAWLLSALRFEAMLANMWGANRRTATAEPVRSLPRPPAAARQQDVAAA
jgi:hypothetical protein